MVYHVLKFLNQLSNLIWQPLAKVGPTGFHNQAPLLCFSQGEFKVLLVATCDNFSYNFNAMPFREQLHIELITELKLWHGKFCNFSRKTAIFYFIFISGMWSFADVTYPKLKLKMGEIERDGTSVSNCGKYEINMINI